MANSKETIDRNIRAKMVTAMEFIARQINDEELFDKWLVLGVADGDIPYGGCYPMDDDTYIEDDNEFADLMDTFLWLMKGAYEDGGLYCDGIVSRPNSDY